MNQRNLLIAVLMVSTSQLWAQKEELDTLVGNTLSGYLVDIEIVNPTNKDLEMALEDRKADFYRFDTKITQPWFDWKRKLNENTGMKLSINYTAAFIGATSKISDENQQTAGSGIFDATLSWNIINRKKGKNQGHVVFWVDSRHLYYGDIAPQNLNFETGSATFPALKFGKWSFRTLEFYYQQKISDRGAIVVGKIDMPDWFTYHGLLHPMLHFSDFAFSVNPTVSWSNPGFGVVAGFYLDNKKRFALVAGLNDVAGDDITQDNFMDFGDTWKEGKFLKMAEFSYTPGSSKWYFNRIGVTVWHSDEVLESDDSWLVTPSSKGFTVQGTWFIKEKYIPIFTFGLSDGDGANSLSRLNISMIHGWYFKSHDLLGVGLNYTESTITGNSQVGSEVFYRFTLSKAVSITPTIKAIIKPALDPDRDFLGYWGVRTRISL